MHNNKAKHLRDEQDLQTELDRVLTELKEAEKQNKMQEQRHQREIRKAQKEDKTYWTSGDQQDQKVVQTCVNECRQAMDKITKESKKHMQSL